MKNKNVNFKERRLVFQQAAPSPAPAFNDPLDALTYAGSVALTEAARIIKFTADTLGQVSGMVGDGIAYGKDKFAKLAEWTADKYYGEPNNNLPDYAYLTKNFSKPIITNANVFEAATLHLRLVFMKYKIQEYTRFMNPLLSEFGAVEARLNAIERNRAIHKSTVVRIEDQIQKIGRTIKNDNLLPSSPRRIALQTQLTSLKSEKKKLEALYTTDVDWPQPEYQETEYPPGSGEYMDRFVSNPGNRVKINLDSYYGWLKGQVALYEGQLKVYKKESESLAYHRGKIVAGNPHLAAQFSTEFAAIDIQGINAISGIHFVSRGSTSPVPGLVNDSGNRDSYFAPATNTGAADFDRKARLLPP